MQDIVRKVLAAADVSGPLLASRALKREASLLRC